MFTAREHLANDGWLEILGWPASNAAVLPLWVRPRMGVLILVSCRKKWGIEKYRFFIRFAFIVQPQIRRKNHNKLFDTFLEAIWQWLLGWSKDQSIMGPSTLLVLFAGMGLLEGTVINRYFKERANCNIGSPQAIILNAAPEVSGCVGYLTQPAQGKLGKLSYKLQENTYVTL